MGKRENGGYGEKGKLNRIPGKGKRQSSKFELAAQVKAFLEAELWGEGIRLIHSHTIRDVHRLRSTLSVLVDPSLKKCIFDGWTRAAVLLSFRAHRSYQPL